MIEGTNETPAEWEAEDPLPEVFPGMREPEEWLIDALAVLTAHIEIGTCNGCAQRPTEAIYSANFPIELCSTCANYLLVVTRGRLFQAGLDPTLVDAR
jgi:hypothetical protein